MAHFVELNEDNIVIRVIVLNNAVITDENGIENEQLGINFCKQLYGNNTKWIQTSYNAKFRGKYAGIGDKYNETNDIFVPYTEF